MYWQCKARSLTGEEWYFVPYSFP